MATEDPISKSAFAKQCNVDASRVSHWISEGKIGQSAIIGQGRNAKILPGVAIKHLRLKLDVGQRLGNGANTRLPTPKPSSAPASEPAHAPSPLPSTFAADIWEVLRDVPRSAAFAAVWAGAPAKIAFIIDQALRLDLKEAVERLTGLPLPGSFDPADWPNIADEAGEPVDMAAWEAWAELRNARVDDL